VAILAVVIVRQISVKKTEVATADNEGDTLGGALDLIYEIGGIVGSMKTPRALKRICWAY